MKEATEKEYFATDRQLLDIAKQAIKRAPTLKGCDVNFPQARNRTCQLYVGGNGISGPVFLDNRGYGNGHFECGKLSVLIWNRQRWCLFWRSRSDLVL